MNAADRRPALRDVTLVAVTSVAIEATLDALRKSMAQAQFARVLLLSDQRPAASLHDVEWRQIGALKSRADYSRFMLWELHQYIDTSHALCVQWDGFVLNGAAWRPEFLDYDYIGAIWPQFTDGHRVGNGGFSLRSRPLLDACKDLAFDGKQPEDVVIGRAKRPQLEKMGVRFAPEEIASAFAYERSSPSGREFGFHGAFNLVRHLRPGEALAIFRSLDPSMLTKSERMEVFRWALLRGRISLASAMIEKHPTQDVFKLPTN